jgi:hypothetical protein
MRSSPRSIFSTRSRGLSLKKSEGISRSPFDGSTSTAIAPNSAPARNAEAAKSTATRSRRNALGISRVSSFTKLVQIGVSCEAR